MSERVDCAENSGIDTRDAFPQEPIEKVIDPLRAFLQSETAGGIVLLLPAGIYLLLQLDGQARQGMGIPMATDNTFVVGILGASVISAIIGAALLMIFSPKNVS